MPIRDQSERSPHSLQYRLTNELSVLVNLVRHPLEARTIGAARAARNQDAVLAAMLDTQTMQIEIERGTTDSNYGTRMNICGTPIFAY